MSKKHLQIQFQVELVQISSDLKRLNWISISILIQTWLAWNTAMNNVNPNLIYSRNLKKDFTKNDEVTSISLNIRLKITCGFGEIIKSWILAVLVWNAHIFVNVQTKYSLKCIQSRTCEHPFTFNAPFNANELWMQIKCLCFETSQVITIGTVDIAWFTTTIHIHSRALSSFRAFKLSTKWHA